MNLNVLEILLVLVTLAGYLSGWFRALGSRGQTEDAPFWKKSSFLLVAGLAAHTLFSIERGFRLGQGPVGTLFETSLFLIWCIVVIYLSIHYAFHLRGTTPYVMPLIGGIFILSGYGLIRHSPENQEVRPHWLTIHITTILLSIAIFTLSFAAGVLYLVQNRRLKDKSQAAKRFKLPPLELLDRLNLRLMILGFSILTFSIILGMVYLRQSNKIQHPLSDPRTLIACVSWLFYGFLLHLRINSAYHGRKVAVISIISFLLLFFAFAGAELIWHGHWYQ